MIDKEKLIKAANSENGKLIIEHLKECVKKLDLNKVAEEGLFNENLTAQLKAIATARKILNDEIRMLTGEIKEEYSILNYLT